MQTLTLFVRFTGDVRDERLAVGSVVEKLQARYWSRIRLEIVPDETEAPGTAWPICPADCELSLGTTDDFAARFEQDLESRIRRELERQHPLAAGPLPPLAGPPFLGAAVFDYDDAPRFFGRDRAIAEALAQLKRNHAAGHAFLLIYGAAGCGKSSMMRAGLAPRLTADGYLPEVGAWCGTTVLPSEDQVPPLETLARALVNALPELEKLRDTSGSPKAPAARAAKGKKGRKAKPAPRPEPVWDSTRLARALGEPQQLVFAVAAITAALDRLSSAKPAHFLLLVDQLDEIFTDREVTAETRDRWCHALAALAGSRRIWVVATLRSALFPRVAEPRDLFQLVRRDGGYFLGAPEAFELRAMIRGPALAAGLQFERDPKSGRELSEQIVEDALAARAALPPLERTLEALDQRRDGQMLTWSAYQALGGLAAAARETALPANDEERDAIQRRDRRKLRGFQVAAAVLAAALIGTALLGHRARQRARAGFDAAMEARARQAADDSRHALAAADFEAGAARLAGGAPDEALPFLIAALEKDPRHLDAQALLVATLRRVAWHVPVAELAHPLPVSKLAFGGDDATLFTATDAGADGINTTLRWHLPEAAIQAVLVPDRLGPTRALGVAPGGRRLVVQRGDGRSLVSFLCDAETLRPIKTLPLAADIPAVCLVWSEEGALLGYPAGTGGERRWVIADAASGEAIRSSEPVGEVLAAQLDRQRLRAFHRDGTLLELPLSITLPERRATADLNGQILDAVLNPDGSELLARLMSPELAMERRYFPLIDRGPEMALEIGAGEASPRGSWLDARSLRDPAGSPVGPVLPPTHAIDGSVVRFADTTGAEPLPGVPLRLGAAVTAVTFEDSRIATATASGQVTVHRILPRIDDDLKRGGPVLAPDADGWAHLENPRAEDAAGGWLAYADEGRLHVWSTRAACRLITDLPLAAGRTTLAFADEKGIRGLRLEGANAGFLPLAKIEGLTPAELAVLRATARAFAGTGLAVDGRTVVRLSIAERRAALAGEITGLPGLFDPQAARAALLESPALTSGPLAWLPLWERLAAMPEVDRSRLTNWAAALGDHPWFRQYLHGEIARSDQRLALAWQGERDPAGPDSGLVPAGDPGIDRLHLLAGDPAATGELKHAAWRAARTEPARLGTLLADPERLKDLPGVDAEKIRALDPAALDALRALLQAGAPGHGSLKLLDEHAGRPAAMALLDARVEATRQAFEATPSSASAIDHAEALALRGETTAAAEFLAGKLPADTVLGLRQAHTLLSFGLEAPAREALDRALDAHASPWLWRQWWQVRRAAGDPLAPLAERMMAAVDGRGPAAVEALRGALADQDAAAIAACLEAAKGLPASLGVYATGAVLWAQGEKAKAFALWPDRFPDLRAEAAAGDWRGWEAALPESADGSLFTAMEKELATLVAGPDASLDDQRALATLLLDPSTTTTFGVKRVRDAMVTCALALASDPASSPLVGQMLDRARLAGAPNPACLRIEARVFMAEGNYTAAYSRWLQLIDADDAEILASDYLEAAACVLEDQQDAAAIELVLRGKTRFPADATFAFDSAWLLLTTAHPEEAGILLEHGFTIPFSEDQQQTAIAMLLCAAEQTGRGERADQALQDLLEISEDWAEEDSIRSLEWPEALTENLLSVAARNR